MSDKKQTPLYDWHRQHGANIVEFGEYLMPVWYGSSKDEHLAVITHAGLFDTSHMAVVRVFGTAAFDVLQWCFTRNLHACVGKDAAPLVRTEPLADTGGVWKPWALEFDVGVGCGPALQLSLQTDAAAAAAGAQGRLELADMRLRAAER